MMRMAALLTYWSVSQVQSVEPLMMALICEFSTKIWLRERT